MDTVRILTGISGEVGVHVIELLTDQEARFRRDSGPSVYGDLRFVLPVGFLEFGRGSTRDVNSVIVFRHQLQLRRDPAPLSIGVVILEIKLDEIGRASCRERV